MKKKSFYCFLLLWMLIPAFAQTLFVLEPCFDFGMGSQDYSYKAGDAAMQANGVWAAFYGAKTGARFFFLDYGNTGLPVDWGGGIYYQHINGGRWDAYSTGLGRSLSIYRLQLQALVSLPLLKNAKGVMAFNAGAYCGFYLCGTFKQSTSNTPTAIPDNNIAPDFGLHVDFTVNLAFFKRGILPAIMGAGGIIFLDINLNDTAILVNEVLNYWQLGTGFTVPVYF